MARNTPRVRRQMPKIYGNLQKNHRDWRPFFRTIIRYFWAVVVITFLYIIFFGPLFRVRSVEVDGVSLSNASYIASTIPLGVSIWKLPTAQINAEIINNQPVDSIDISRGLPSTVKLIVHERQPVLAWASAGTITLVDDTGTAFLQYALNQLPRASTDLGTKITTLPHVIDTQNLPVKIDTQVAGSSFVQFVQDTLTNLHTYLPTYTWDHAEVGATLYDITFVNSTGIHVEMNTLADSGIQVRNLTRLVQQGKVQPTSTVDLRIDRWAYISNAHK